MSKWMTIYTIGFLSLWVLVPLVAIAWPSRHHDPQRGMAVGLLMIVAMIGAALGGLFALGYALKQGWLMAIPKWTSLITGGWIGVVLAVGLVRVVIAKALRGS